MLGLDSIIRSLYQLEERLETLYHGRQTNELTQEKYEQELNSAINDYKLQFPDEVKEKLKTIINNYKFSGKKITY